MPEAEASKADVSKGSKPGCLLSLVSMSAACTQMGACANNAHRVFAHSVCAWPHTCIVYEAGKRAGCSLTCSPDDMVKSVLLE